VSPSLLIRAQDGTPLNADLNVNVIFHNRSGESVTAMLHFKLSEKFNFGYLYDWLTADIRKFSNGTHEFILNYRVRIHGIHKDVLCPQPFTR
jgi:Type IX secretion system membrane protein PorP/SprF